MLVFQNTFDSVHRTKLWKTLFNSGMNGKMLSIIISLYEKVKCCVKYKGVLFDIGLMQGGISISSAVLIIC